MILPNAQQTFFKAKNTMTQNYTNTGQNQAESQALVKSDKNSHALTVKGKGSLLVLTDSILSSAIAARKASQLAVDESWIERIWEWADKFKISEDDIPRNRSSLLTLTKIVIDNFDLSELTRGIGQLTNLTHLGIMWNNELTELPDSIGQLTNLTELGISNNKLTELPDSIGQLTNLTYLSISDNELTELPDWIGQLTNLTHLGIGGNELTELPDSIGQLTNLTYLDISDNQLTELPDWIDQLINLSLPLGWLRA